MTTLTINDAILAVVKDFGMSPEEINDGFCYDFASAVSCLLPSAEVWHIPDYHAYLKHGGRYYDAEAPAGVKLLRDLPIFKRYQTGRPDPIRGRRIR